MLVCFVSDIHGSDAQYERLADLLRRERPGVVILGGDMFPDGDEADPSGSQARYVREVFLPRAESWRSELGNLEIACILGNHDWLTTKAELAALHESGRLVLLSAKKPWACNGVSYLGFSHTPPTPFWLKDFERLDTPEDQPPHDRGRVWDPDQRAVRDVELADYFRSKSRISEMLANVTKLDGRWIFVCHAPPHDTKLDWLPNIDEPVGSKSVRAFIEERKPLCTLHGHIHESPKITGAYRDEVGGVLCVNPGQAEDTLNAVLFDSNDPAGTLRHTVYA